jgi:hypothetical protein
VSVKRVASRMLRRCCSDVYNIQVGDRLLRGGKSILWSDVERVSAWCGGLECEVAQPFNDQSF